MRRLTYREVKQKWNDYNFVVFGGMLKMPKISILARGKDSTLGWCWQRSDKSRVLGIGLNCAALCEDEWEETLLHEMFHQYEWEILKLPFEREDCHEYFGMYEKFLRSIGLHESIL